MKVQPAKSLARNAQRGKRRGSVTVEYLLLCTIVGIGVLTGLAQVRTALVSELNDVAAAIAAIL